MRAFTAAVVILIPRLACGVTPIRAGALIEYKANSFDLDGKRLRFAPEGTKGYSVRTDASDGLLERGAEVRVPPGASGRLGSRPIQLACPFPFAGKNWNEVHLNTTGNLTFGAPETELYPERDTWPGGTMRFVAAAIDSRSLAGRELMIAPLWGLYSYDASKIYVNSSAHELVVTWDAVRYQYPNEGYAPLGHNIFQARLTPDGAIEFRYHGIAEKDGIVGVFSGQPFGGKLLDSAANRAVGKGPGPQVLSAKVEDAGTALHFALALSAPPPAKTSDDAVAYLVVVPVGDELCKAGLRVDAAGQSAINECPGYAYAAASGSAIEVYVSKLGLGRLKQFTWAAAAIADNETSISTATGALGRRKVKLENASQAGVDLSASTGILGGNIYEVFHYPFVPKDPGPALRAIYRKVPPQDDLAIIFTDFRIDDLHNHSGGIPAANVRVEGIGSDSAEAADGKAEYGSRVLQQAAGPVYLGPRFQEAPRDDEGRNYRNYAFAVGWMAHELTHRWSAFLRSPTPDADALRDTIPCHCHWSDWLHTPSVSPVWQLFTDVPYPESSNMGGYLFEARADGSFLRRHAPWPSPLGLSALDLYVMGLIAPEEVPETFLLTNPKDLGGNIVRGDKTPIRIADILSANGPRKPPAAASQREFKLGIYLLYEGNAPLPDKLAQARAMETKLIEYFTVATGGRLKLVTTRLAR